MRSLYLVGLLFAALSMGCQKDSNPEAAENTPHFGKPPIHEADVPLDKVPEFVIATFRADPYFKDGVIRCVRKTWSDNDWVVYMATIDQPDGQRMSLGYEWFTNSSLTGRLIQRTWEEAPNKQVEPTR